MKKSQEIKKSVFYPVARPVFNGNELKYVTDAIKTGWVSSVGSYVTKFEEEFAKFCGVKYAVSCSNGTTALHLALIALGIGPGDEVIVPAFTFIATANAVKHAGAKPVMVDIEPAYWQISLREMEKAITPKTKAIIPVHLYGHPAKMDDLVKIARRHNLYVIEDAAEALGAEVSARGGSASGGNGRKVGAWGDLGCFSFFGNKIITTGEGGMITTDDKKLADKINILKAHGMEKGGNYYHEVLGYNYRLTNIQSALGLAQLEKINSILRKKLQVAAWYKKHLQGVRGVSFQPEAGWARAVYWMVCLVLDPQIVKISRDELAKKLKSAGIDTRPFFLPLHRQPVYAGYKNLHFPNTETISKLGLNLPSSIDLKESDIVYIAGKVKAFIDHA